MATAKKDNEIITADIEDIDAEITDKELINETPEEKDEPLKEIPDEGEGANDNDGASDAGVDEILQTLEGDDNPRFTKEQILNSHWYSHRRDVLTALLEDDKAYSHGDINRLLQEFLKGKVK